MKSAAVSPQGHSATPPPGEAVPDLHALRDVALHTLVDVECTDNGGLLTKVPSVLEMAIEQLQAIEADMDGKLEGVRHGQA